MNGSETISTALPLILFCVVAWFVMTRFVKFLGLIVLAAAIWIFVPVLKPQIDSLLGPLAKGTAEVTSTVEALKKQCDTVNATDSGFCKKIALDFNAKNYDYQESASAVLSKIEKKIEAKP